MGPVTDFIIILRNFRIGPRPFARQLYLWPLDQRNLNQRLDATINGIKSIKAEVRTWWKFLLLESNEATIWKLLNFFPNYNFNTPQTKSPQIAPKFIQSTQKRRHIIFQCQFAPYRVRPGIEPALSRPTTPAIVPVGLSDLQSRFSLDSTGLRKDIDPFYKYCEGNSSLGLLIDV